MSLAETAPQATPSGPFVLIVDDEAATRTLLRKIVTGVAPVAQVQEAADGDSALLVAQSSPPDLVLLDIVLPGSETSGVLLCQQFCKQHTKVMIVSGNATGSILDACLAAGATAVLRKPFTVEDAQAKIRACLED